ncbi:PREDICTED: uncharacterized protein LOC106817620 isoform X2 [Priapulus caudatus]|uniref:Uncharacterized protein LOC106817620 isoform X1 n=1 Tax=Priapulus caudatus TaxID=37621 RepID=A0ABM1F013_PRICU|nr:PREDICTED: uncharacterized protein LOC106817620 isoform X1 [Priapulus caudatus]XP_014677785.1 PREDICTED: uncharacterized protein LOC106817620 isoform X2 [Priapulus caudatus]
MLSTICCSTLSMDCMYRDCDECKDRRVPFQPYEQTDQVIWEEWRVVDHEYMNKTTKKIDKTKRTEKVKLEGTMDELTDRFEENLGRKLARHVFNIRHQYQQLKLKKESLAENEMLMHIDFSENYTLKYHSEIQSCHFGASNQQVTLHTGMLYMQKESRGFASISSCRRHDAAAIWAHLKPLFDDVAQHHPEIDTAYFISDGPTTQYRCKTNFFLMSTLPYEWGIKCVNWSLLEAGHGKGAADGIGGVLKRTADRVVVAGANLTDAESVYKALHENTRISLYMVTEEDVLKIDQYVNSSAGTQLRSIPGTMSFHQLISVEKGKLQCRRVSCFQCEGLSCQCYKPVTHTFHLNG